MTLRLGYEDSKTVKFMIIRSLWTKLWQQQSCKNNHVTDLIYYELCLKWNCKSILKAGKVIFSMIGLYRNTVVINLFKMHTHTYMSRAGVSFSQFSETCLTKPTEWIRIYNSKKKKYGCVLSQTLSGVLSVLLIKPAWLEFHKAGAIFYCQVH